MKKYIILGSNNYWYSTFSAYSLDEAMKEMEDIKNSHTDYSVAQPETFYLYEVSEAGRIENNI